MSDPGFLADGTPMPPEPDWNAVRNSHLDGPAGGNLPINTAEEEGVRRVGDITIRVLDAEKGKMEVTDRVGRTLTVQRLSELERFDLYEAFGTDIPNAYTAAMGALAATLRNVKNKDGSGTGRAFPKNKTHIRGAIQLLGEAGMDALRVAFTPEEPEKADDAEGPDADGVMPDGSMAIAKN